MIIASDLDRTLIYSNRALDELGRPEESVLKPVESREGKWVSFMTNASFAALEALCRQYLFVPITTRTTEQYKRITIFQQELPLLYAITTNGATILQDGERMKEWSVHLSSKMRTETAAMEEIISFLQKEDFPINGKRKQVEDLFFYFILTSPISIKDKKSLCAALAQFGWNVSLQGRKLYLIPKVINKGDALEFVCSQKGARAIAGSGDSILDLDFLAHCRYRFVPNHGELVQDPSNMIPEIFVTKNRGILAGEEILNHYLSL